MKIQISGYSGSGKSTFASRLSSFYNIDVLHIDAIRFDPNWIDRDPKMVEQEIKNFINQENWIVDGQYTKLASERFEICDQLFLFDFNRMKCLYGVFRRYCKYRGKTRESISKGCNEQLNWEFIKWVLKDGRKKHIKLRNKAYKDLYKDKIIVFKNRKQVNTYLKSIGYTYIHTL